MENLLVPYQAVTNIPAMHVLVLAPHPDDEVFGCGGAIMRHVEQGTPLHVIVVSDGAYGIDDDNITDYVRQRQNESIDAANVLGYGMPVFWQYRDRGIYYGEKLVQEILTAISETQADLIYAPSVFEMHPDHRALGMATVEAIRRIGKTVRLALYEVGIPLHPNRLLNISDLAERKQKAMTCFISQNEKQRYDLDIAALNRYRTYTLPADVTAAEAYMLVTAEELANDPLRLYQSEHARQKSLGLPLDSRDMPLVSVIIRSMDRVTLSDALDSVALQTYPNIEVLVINARGGQHAALHDQCGPFPLRLVNQGGEALHRSYAANLGLTTSQGTYLGFLDDDDTLAPDHIQSLIEVLQREPAGTVAYSGIRGMHRNDPEHRIIATFAEPKVSFERLLLGNVLPIHAPLFPVSLVTAGVRFDEGLNLYEDWDFWLRLIRRTPFVYTDKFTGTYYLGSESGASPLAPDQRVTEQAAVTFFSSWRQKLSAEDLKNISVFYLSEYNRLQQATAQVASQAQQLDALHHTVAKLNRFMEELQEKFTERGQKIQTLESLKIALRSQKATLETQSIKLNEQVSERKRQYENQLNAYRKKLDAVYSSRSWRLTAPLRKLHLSMNHIFHKIWQIVPMKFTHWQLVKQRLFCWLPFLFRWSRAYQNWERDNQPVSDQPTPVSVSENEFYEFLEPGLNPYVPLLDAPPPAQLPVRLIAFYLPQFHPIPENDVWWGTGFTEWTNVRPAQPQFEGHYQPHEPGELGYYDLLDPTVQQRQVELAKLYGIGGFCFYFYWFAGQRLLEAPVENYLNNPELDLPFCLCWANESWRRSWDGLDQEILIAQQYSPEDDLAFIEHVAKYMRDERYIRINGRPLLVVYRPGQLPEPKATARRWRQWCRENGFGEIYLAYTQSFETVDPARYAFDAAIEFPPYNMGPPEITNSIAPLSSDFSGTAYDWRYFVKRSRSYKVPNYTLFHSCCPSWDNTARRKERGTIFLHSSPHAYREWLTNAIYETCERITNTQERLVFVNAWNEWAQGAHLEPDQKYGYAWLDATRKALVGSTEAENHKRIIVVSHDALPHGAQFLALGLVGALIRDLGLEIEVVLLGPGQLKSEFAALAPVHDLSTVASDSGAVTSLATDFVRRGFVRAILNTTVSGWITPLFAQAGISCLCLVHELPGVIRQYELQSQANQLAAAATRVIFPSQIVAEGFGQFAQVDPQRQVIRPQGLYRRNRWRYSRQKAKAEIYLRLGLAAETRLILAVGYADQRKGVDLFVESALQILALRADADFVWVGHWEAQMQEKIEARLKHETAREHLHFVGFDADTATYHAASDIYALTSREDPFPNVVLESFDVGVPVVAFAGTGGAAEMVAQTGGLVVDSLDPKDYARALNQLLDDDSLAEKLGTDGQQLVDRQFSFRTYIFDLCQLLDLDLPRVSVIVPNYNYARFLEQRLDSIRQQSVPFYQLILLDDASTDQSLATIQTWLIKHQTEAQLIVNSKNSDNVFAQWSRGIALARGDYIWIAEADDLSDPDFLATVLPPMSNSGTVLSYCESCQINQDGQLIASDYSAYLKPLSPRTWRKAYQSDGPVEIVNALAVMNTIPNVSAVLFRRSALKDVFERCFEQISTYRKAGDWLVYVRVLAEGRIAFSPRPANKHRRHENSVIAAGSAKALCDEIARLQQLVDCEYDLDPQVKTRAENYLASLHKQFGLQVTNEITL